MATTTAKEIHPSIPLERAWQVGRRVYVRAAFDSPLNDGLRAMRATWDAEVRARYVGTTKKPAVVELILELEPEALDPSVPLDKAWKTGRRIYVACGLHSRLRADLNRLGAQWDNTTRAVWVDASHTESVLAALAAAEKRATEVAAVKILGLWLDIPFDAETVRDAANEARAIYDREHGNQWAFRDPGSLAAVTELRDRWITETDEARRLQQVEADRVEEANREGVVRLRRDRLAVSAGRTLTGETVEHRVVSTQHFNRYRAESAALDDGTIVRLADGRRGLVYGRRVWFTNDEMASSVCWHQETQGEAHWDFLYTVAVVEPSAAEIAADERAAGEHADAAVVHALVEQAPALTGATSEDRWTDIPAEDRAGVITATAGTTGSVREGHLIVTWDGAVVWQHPGFYDDYIRSEGITRDPAVVARVRAVLDRGTRERVVRGPYPRYYQVKVMDA